MQNLLRDFHILYTNRFTRVIKEHIKEHIPGENWLASWPQANLFDILKPYLLEDEYVDAVILSYHDDDIGNVSQHL